MGEEPLRAWELFSGIGGQTMAAAGRLEIVGAVDQKAAANATYEHNHGLAPFAHSIAALNAADLLAPGPAGWLMSPPCQPFTQKGLQRDMEDPRNQALLRLVRLLHEVVPPFILLENVPPFGQSRSRERLVNTLRSLEYHVVEVTLCPSELGIPNLRSRYYLLARRTPLGPRPQLTDVGRPLAAYLDPAPTTQLYVDRTFVRRYGRGMDFVTADSPRTACFGSSYGRAALRAGSYITDNGGVRRFSPREMLRFLHFPESFSFPGDLPMRMQYQLVGNSVNVAVVRYLIDWLLT